MKKWFYPASLIIIFIILTSVIIPAGCVYGSNTDWLSQHVTLAESIRTACLLAHSGDVILIAGKGHENYQEIKGVKHHFDDKEILKAIFDNEQ